MDHIAQRAISDRRAPGKGHAGIIIIVRQFLLLLLESLDDFHMSS